MDRETVIWLQLEQQADCFLVSSPQFPLLHLALESGSEADLTEHVLPVLKEMVEHQLRRKVTLQLLPEFGAEELTDDQMLAPHVIAVMQASHVG